MSPNKILQCENAIESFLYYNRYQKRAGMTPVGYETVGGVWGIVIAVFDNSGVQYYYIFLIILVYIE